MNQKHHRHNSRASNVLTPPESSQRYNKPRRARKFLWLRKPLRLTYLKLWRLRGRPKFVAKGLAVGVFAGCFPFLGMQSILGIFLATMFKASRVAAVAATWISNPLTYVPIFVFNYKIGKLLLRTEDTVSLPLDLKSFTAFKEQGATFAIALLTGSFVVGMILAVITYFYGLAILERWKNNRRLNKKRSRRL